MSDSEKIARGHERLRLARKRAQLHQALTGTKHDPAWDRWSAIVWQPRGGHLDPYVIYQCTHEHHAALGARMCADTWLHDARHDTGEHS